MLGGIVLMGTMLGCPPLSLRSKESKKSRGKDAEDVRPKMVRPTGPIPMPLVVSRHEGVMIERGSKGFSYGEVQGSGIPMLTAERWRVPLDIRRRSVLEGNVQALKGWYSKSKRVGGAGEVRKIEEELGKIEKGVEKEVKRGATKVKKEVVRAEKGAKRLEEKAVAKVEEPVRKRRAKKTSKDAQDEDSAKEN